MKRVCHLSSVHSADDVRIFHKECLTLAGAGYEVSYVVPCEAGGVRGGVMIHPVPLPRRRSDRILRTALQVVRTALQVHAQVYHFHDPELLPWTPFLRRHRAKVIYDAHEDVGRQILTKDWVPSRLRRGVAWGSRAVEWMVTRMWVDAVIAATPAIARNFPAFKTEVVQNFPLQAELAPVSAQPYEKRPPHIVYIGGVTVIRGAREMVEAMRRLSPHLNARLLIAGMFDPPALRALFEDCERTILLGWLPREQVAMLLGQARIGLVLFHPVPNHIEAQPNKLFEYMSAGIPVIASDFPLWREIVDTAKCGLLVDPLDPVAIARAIEWLLTHPAEAEAMGKRGREAVQDRYNWECESQKLLALYAKLIGGPE